MPRLHANARQGPLILSAFPNRLGCLLKRIVKREFGENGYQDRGRIRRSLIIGILIVDLSNPESSGFGEIPKGDIQRQLGLAETNPARCNLAERLTAN